MQLNIHDSTLKKVGYINNDVPNALHYYDDNWHRYLAEGTSTFDFSVNKVNPAYSLITLESYISFTYNDEDYLFNIVNIQQDHSTMQIQCENLNLELISEEVGTYSNTKRHSIVWYLRNAAKITDNVLEIGNNPFSEVDEDKTNPILTFDSTETKLARILSICNSFNAEFRFKTELKDDGTLQSITLDLYKSSGVGQVRKDVTLFYGKNVAGITSIGDRTSTFFNATTVTDSNKKYDWLSVEGNYINSEGKLEFYKKAGENTAYAILSRDMFPSQLNSASADRYTRKDLSIEASSADSLWDYAVSQFKLYAYPQMTYDVVVSVNAVTRALGNNKVLDIGDTVTIQDSTFDKSDGGLILSARVSEQEISFTNPANNKITFSNFVRLKSQISADLLSRMKDIVNENTPYKAELETTNGVQFKNSAGTTTLTARIYKGSEVKETIADSYSWSKDGNEVANAQSITIDGSSIIDKSVFVFTAKINDNIVASQSVTITNVNDGTAGKPGADGKTQYTHIAYANSADGVTNFSTSDSNRTYIGMYVDFNIDDSNTPGDYSWTLVKGADGTQGTPGKPGADGKTPYFHTAWSYSADGTEGFTTVYPNLNLLDGTRDFSGTWSNAVGSVTDGTYKGLTVKKRTGQWFGIYKTFTAPKDGTYTFSAYIKSSGNNAGIYRLIFRNDVNVLLPNKFLGSNFDWSRDSFSITLEAGDTIHARYEISGTDSDSILWTAGHKYEEGSTATPWMTSSSEVTTADWPSYIGQYTDFTQADSTNPSAYTWSLIRGNDGKDGANGKDGIAGKDGVGIKTTVITYAISTSGTEAPTTGWTSSVPSLVKGQYLWTKTVWTYTDNSSETGYSVTYISKDGNNGNDGIAGKDGNGIKTTTITYVGSTSGTTVPTSGWTSTIPTVAAGSYLWTKTVWTYTDNTSETGYSVAKMGNTGATGPAGPPGSTGAPGKIVSDTEPTTKFNGLTWKYSGITAINASDGTNIQSNTEYYWNGKNWVLNQINAHNINVDDLSAISTTLTNGKFISNWSSVNATGSTMIDRSNLIINSANTLLNTQNTIVLDSELGMIMTYTDKTNNRTVSAGVNFQGVSTSDSNGNYAQLTPQGTKLSTDVPWTTLAATGGFHDGAIQFSVQNGVAYFSVSNLITPTMTSNKWYQCAQLPTGSSAIPSVNRATTAFSNASVWGFYVATTGGLYFKSFTNVTVTNNSTNVLAAFPIG